MIKTVLYRICYGRKDFPGGSDSKVSAYNVGDPGSTPGLGRSSGKGNGTPLQYSCLENPVDRGAWWATVHGVAELDTTERLPSPVVGRKLRHSYRLCVRLASESPRGATASRFSTNSSYCAGFRGKRSRGRNRDRVSGSVLI